MTVSNGGRQDVCRSSCADRAIRANSKLSNKKSRCRILANSGRLITIQKHRLQSISVKASPGATLDLSKVSVSSDEIVRSGAYGGENESRETLDTFLEDRGRSDLADKVSAGKSITISGDLDPDHALLGSLGFGMHEHPTTEQLTEAASRKGYDSVACRDELLVIDPRYYP